MNTRELPLHHKGQKDQIELGKRGEEWMNTVRTSTKRQKIQKIPNRNLRTEKYNNGTEKYTGGI